MTVSRRLRSCCSCQAEVPSPCLLSHPPTWAGWCEDDSNSKNQIITSTTGSVSDVAMNTFSPKFLYFSQQAYDVMGWSCFHPGCGPEDGEEHWAWAPKGTDQRQSCILPIPPLRRYINETYQVTPNMWLLTHIKTRLVRNCFPPFIAEGIGTKRGEATHWCGAMLFSAVKFELRFGWF